MPIPRRVRNGDHLVKDDRTGFTRWASECQREWNGLLVSRKVWEARHPQDFVRGVKDDMRVDPARPQPDINNYPTSGPRTTLVALAAYPGNYGLIVESIADISAGDWLRVALDNADMFTVRAVSAPIRIDSTRFTIDDPILLIDSPYSIELASPLPWMVAVGNLVTNISNVVTSSPV